MKRQSERGSIEQSRLNDDPELLSLVYVGLNGSKVRLRHEEAIPDRNCGWDGQKR